MRLPVVKSAALAAAFAFLAVPAAAQSFWLDHDSPELSLEVLRPAPANGDLTFFSFTAFATMAARVGESALLVVEVPFSRAELDLDGAEGSTALGNPYVGIRSLPSDATGLRWSGGVRIPLAPDDAGLATFTGLMSSVSDRYEAFFPDVLALSGAGRYVAALSDVAYVSGRLGAVADIITEGNNDAEFFALYGGKVWVESDGLNAGLGFSGRYWLSEENVDFGDRTLHELGIWADYDFGGVRPGIRIQFPLGELGNEVDQVVGLYVRYGLP